MKEESTEPMEQEIVESEAEQATSAIEIQDGEAAESGDSHGEQSAEPADELERLRAENQDLQARFLRARADAENIKRRADRERQEAIKYANKNVLTQLLDVVDNFERAMTAVQDPKDSFVIGVKMIQKQLDDVMRDNGVEEVEAIGKPFDPYLHEALAKEPTDDVEEGTIIEVFQRGFRYKGQLLRAVKVKVAAAKNTEDQGESNEETN